MYRLKKILVKISSYYKLDPRALSLLRIGIAIVIIVDLMIRGADLSAHYTDDGVYPSDYVRSYSWLKGYWTIHDLINAYWWVLALFVLHFCFALFLLSGFKTRLSTFVLWVLYISLHNRNIFINQAGDDLLRLLLFWGLFLPWSSYYSFDSRHAKPPKQKPLANLGYLLLIASVYFFTASLKYGKDWTIDGTAIYYALSLEQLRLPGIGEWLYQQGVLMKLLTWVVLGIEWIVPVLILIPSRKGYLRGIAVILLLFLHLGIGLTLYVGLFFIINIVSSFGLIPSSFMDIIERTWIPSKFNNRAEILRKASVKNRNWSFISNSICLIVIIISLIINLAGVKWFSYELTEEALLPVRFTRMDQYWGMFSPNVLKRDGWYVYYGIDSIGRQWDLIRNEDYVSFEKPEKIIKIHSSDRWRKLTENIQNDDFAFLRPLFCKYILRRWNKKHPEKKIFTLNLYYMQKETLPGYKTTPIEKKLYSVCNDN